jgi:hypothetical protein
MEDYFIDKKAGFYDYIKPKKLRFIFWCIYLIDDILRQSFVKERKDWLDYLEDLKDTIKKMIRQMRD